MVVSAPSSLPLSLKTIQALATLSSGPLPVLTPATTTSVMSLLGSLYRISSISIGETDVPDVLNTSLTLSENLQRNA